MLVCNVSQRAQRAAIAAGIVEEAGAADDVPSLAGFALLVDEPAAASEALSAFVGQILIEAANAGETVNAGSKYAVLIDAPAIAADAYSGTTGVVIAGLSEAAAAADVPDATKISGLVPRHAMVEGVFINSDGTARQANAAGVMVNL